MTAQYALAKVGATDRGSFHELLTAVLMSALAFEAALNQAGEYVWMDEPEIWAAIEAASPMSKFAAISEQVHFKFEKGARPYQTVAELMRLRNDIVHGKPEHFSAQVPRALRTDRDSWHTVMGLSAKWEQACDEAFVLRALEDVVSLVDALCTQIGMPSPMHVGGLTTHSL